MFLASTGKIRENKNFSLVAMSFYHCIKGNVFKLGPSQPAEPVQPFVLPFFNSRN